MAYKTCPDCGSRIFEYGCVNCNEQDYISMQGAYDELEPRKLNSERNVQASVATDDGGSTKAGNQKAD